MKVVENIPVTTSTTAETISFSSSSLSIILSSMRSLNHNVGSIKITTIQATDGVLSISFIIKLNKGIALFEVTVDYLAIL